MSERTTTRLFGWSLGAVLFTTLALNAAFRLRSRIIRSSQLDAAKEIQIADVAGGADD